MSTNQPHSANLRLHRLLDGPGTFFVTKSLQPKKAVLCGEWSSMVVNAFLHNAVNGKALFAAFVVMPDHWHALFAPTNDVTLPALMRNLMGFIGAKTTKYLVEHGCAWQEGYYESRIRSTKQLMYVCKYIEMNPVRKELASTPEAWHASSAAQRAIIITPWPWDFPGDHA